MDELSLQLALNVPVNLEVTNSRGIDITEMRDAEESPSLEPQNLAEQHEGHSFFHFDVLDWCDLQNSFQTKYCYETLALDSSVSERVEHLLKESLFNGGQRSWNDLASVKLLEMELDLNSNSPLF